MTGMSGHCTAWWGPPTWRDFGNVEEGWGKAPAYDSRHRGLVLSCWDAWRLKSCELQLALLQRRCKHHSSIGTLDCRILHSTKFVQCMLPNKHASI